MNLYSITIAIDDSEHAEFVEALTIVDAIDLVCAALDVELGDIQEITLVAKGGVIRQVEASQG